MKLSTDCTDINLRFGEFAARVAGYWRVVTEKILLTRRPRLRQDCAKRFAADLQQVVAVCYSFREIVGRSCFRQCVADESLRRLAGRRLPQTFSVAERE